MIGLLRFQDARAGGVDPQQMFESEMCSLQTASNHRAGSTSARLLPASAILDAAALNASRGCVGRGMNDGDLLRLKYGIVTLNPAGRPDATSGHVVPITQPVEHRSPAARC
jgi:hypothetical protein